jgi:hypothetical protein
MHIALESMIHKKKFNSELAVSSETKFKVNSCKLQISVKSDLHIGNTTFYSFLVVLICLNGKYVSVIPSI